MQQGAARMDQGAPMAHSSEDAQVTAVRYFVGGRPERMLETRTANSRQRWIVNRLGVAYFLPPECQDERSVALRARWPNRFSSILRLLVRDSHSGGPEHVTWTTKTLS